MPRPRRSRAISALAYAPQALLIALARALPHRARLVLGAGVLRAALMLVPDLRARVEANLALVFPRMPESQRRDIRRAMAGNVGRTLIEMLTGRAYRRRAAWSGPVGPGWQALREARAEGRGAILVSGHFGQWEALRGVLAEQGIECGGLYRPVKNPYLERFYRAELESGGGPICARDGAGLRRFVRHLRGGGVALVLLDQYVKRGVPIDFLGHPAPSGTMIAALALKHRLPMIPFYGTRDAGGVQVAVDLEDPIPPGTALQMTQAAADSLAARIRAHPGQYYWLHQRWVKRR